MLAIIFALRVQVRAGEDGRRCFVLALASRKDLNPREGRRICLSSGLNLSIYGFIQLFICLQTNKQQTTKRRFIELTI